MVRFRRDMSMINRLNLIFLVKPKVPVVHQQAPGNLKTFLPDKCWHFYNILSSSYTSRISFYFLLQLPQSNVNRDKIWHRRGNKSLKIYLYKNISAANVSFMDTLQLHKNVLGPMGLECKRKFHANATMIVCISCHLVAPPFWKWAGGIILFHPTQPANRSSRASLWGAFQLLWSICSHFVWKTENFELADLRKYWKRKNSWWRYLQFNSSWIDISETKKTVWVGEYRTETTIDTYGWAHLNSV